MSIASRITSIEKHIKESYQELEGIGIDTTGVNKNLENIPKLIDGYWETLPKVTGEGTSITLDNTKEGKMKIVLKGNTSQEGTPTPETPQDIHVVSGDNSIVVGNNVFDISTITPNSFIDNNGNIYSSSASNLSDYIEVKENDIILSYDYTSLVSTNTRAYCWFDSNKNFISGNLYSPVNKINTFSVVSGVKYIRFTYDKNISNIKVSNQSASYPVNLPVENLLNIGTATFELAKTYTGLNIPAGTYTFSAKVTSSDTDYSKSRVYFYNSSDAQITYIDLSRDVRTSGTITINDTIAKITMYASTAYGVSSGDTATYENVQLEKGSKANSYTPYGTTPIELLHIPNTNYQDSIFNAVDGDEIYDNLSSEVKETLEYGSWYVEKKVGKVVLNGSETGWSYPSANRFNLDNFANNYLKSTGSLTHLSNYYKAFEQTQDNGVFNTLTANTNYGFNLSSTPSNYYTARFKNTNITSVDDFKTWLSTHNTIVYYVLATPTYTEITDSTLLSQLNALAKSYASQTNISQESNDLASLLNATALEEME